jgi:hypothetical protein
MWNLAAAWSGIDGAVAFVASRRPAARRLSINWGAMIYALCGRIGAGSAASKQHRPGTAKKEARRRRVSACELESGAQADLLA